MLIALLTGFVAAFVLSMPVAGPTSALVVRRSLEGHRRTAIVLGLSSGLGEGCYAFLSLWGFSSLIVDFPVLLTISNAAAAVILLGLGYWFTRFVAEEPSVGLDGEPEGGGEPSTKAAFILGLSVTFLNPTLLITWGTVTATIASLGIFYPTTVHAMPFAIGVSLGGGGWFVVLALLLSKLRERFSTGLLERIIRVMGWALILGSIWFGYKFLSDIGVF